MGDVDRAFATFDDFDVSELKPNADSFSYHLEALALDVSEETHRSGEAIEDRVMSRVDAAESVLALMKEDGFPLCNHALHEYVRLLCFAGDTDKALTSIDEALETNLLVADKTLLFLATKFGATGQIEAARDLASKTTDRWHFLEKRIDTWEKQFKAQQLPDKDI